jgi:DNA-binding transcriptional MerR regulator
MTNGDALTPASKDKGNFRMREVSRLTGVKSFVLRYWEKKFPMLRPFKNSKGHRLYRRADIETVFEIKRLLHEQGFTIAGARRYLAEHSDGEAGETTIVGREQPGSSEANALTGGSHEARVSAAQRRLLLNLREKLVAILTLLKAR